MAAAVALKRRELRIISLYHGLVRAARCLKHNRWRAALFARKGKNVPKQRHPPNRRHVRFGGTGNESLTLWGRGRLTVTADEIFAVEIRGQRQWSRKKRTTTRRSVSIKSGSPRLSTALELCASGSAGHVPETTRSMNETGS